MKTKGNSRALAIVQKFYPGVTTVRDAARDLSVEVTRRDLNSAKVRNHGLCAMAVACQRTEEADGMIISVNTGYIIKGKVAIRYRVPQSVAREIVSFDRGAPFAAGEYELKKPYPYAALGSERQSSGGHARNGDGSKPRVYHQTVGIRTTLIKSKGDD